MNNPQANTPENGHALLSVAETAVFLNVSRAHLHRMNLSGQLPVPIKLGRRVLFNKLELLRFIEAGCPNRARWAMMKAQYREAAK